MTRRSIKIENALYALTMDAGRRIIADAAILIEGDTITRIGKSSELADIPADETIDASDFVLTPGFIGGHMHISYAHATRGIFPDDLGAAYLPNVFKLQSAMLPEEERLTSLLGITELLKYGTTTFVDPGSTQNIAACMDAYRVSGCRVVTGVQVTDKSNPLNVPTYHTDEALAMTEAAIAEFHGELDGMMEAWAMPFSSEYASPELLSGVSRIAKDRGTRVTIHHSFSDSAVEAWTARAGATPTGSLQRDGFLDGDVLLAHALGITEDDVRIIAESGASVVMCPPAAAKGGSGMTRDALLPELLDAGVNVALGTDAPNNSNLIETLRSVYLSAILYKDGRRDVSMIPAETALELGTVRGAEALGMVDKIGSIEVGKKADLVLFDTMRPEWRTLFNPVNNLVYSADGRSVHTVIVNGKVAVRDHIPTFVDERELIGRVQRVGESMLDRTGVSFPPRWPVV